MSENTNRRTSLSKWVYRVSLSLLILGTVRGAHFMWDQLPLLMGGAQGAALRTAQFSVMSGPISLGICAAAMFLRSGAVVWLLGMQFFFTATPLLISVSPERGPFILTATFTTAAFVIGAAVLTYLISKQELRVP